VGKASRKKKVPVQKAPDSAGRHDSGPNHSPSKGVNNTEGLALRTRALIAASAGFLTFLVFLPALRNGFINWDDNEYVYDNPFIRSLDTRLLKSAFGGFHASNWHPLTWISHALDYLFWGLHPLGHHLTNNILHALNTVIVVLLVMQLMEILKNTGGSNAFLNSRTVGITGAITGLLFGLHPLHVESVAWVAERKDVLCAFFFLLSLTAYTKHAEAVRRGPAPDAAGSPLFGAWYFLSFGFFAFALMSKPMAVTLPAVLLILDWYPLGRISSLKTVARACAEKLPFFALSLLSSIVTILAQKAGGAMTLTEAVPLSTRVIVAVKALAVYLWKMIVPLNLVPFYPYPKDVSVFSPGYLFPIFLVIGITAACVVSSKKHRIWPAVWGYYVITLLPVLGIIQVGGQSMADRYTYLPGIGPFLLVGLAGAKICEKVAALDRHRAMAGIAALSAALAVLTSISYATVRQIGIWKDSAVFWNYVIREEPQGVPVAYNNLGLVYASEGRWDKALAEFRTALLLKPDYAEARRNLGIAYASQGRWDSAITEYQEALRLKPQYAEAHYDLGIAYASQGRWDDAITEYRTALRLKA
jgi:hypothetical protein